MAKRLILTLSSRQPLVLPESTAILQAVERFKAQPARVDVIVDEFGALQGIVTRTDLLEAIAGDLLDVGEKSGSSDICHPCT